MRRIIVTAVLLLIVTFITSKSFQVFAVTDTASSDATVVASSEPDPFASPVPVASPNPLNVTLSPVTLNLQAKPGQPLSAPIKIRNNGTETENLTISFGTFKADSSGQKPQLLDPSPNDEFMKWIAVDQPEISVGPGEWKTIRFTFSPPADAALSYYYTIIFNRTSITALPGQTNIEGAPAMLVLTNVESPNAKRELQVDSFLAANPITEFLPETFKIKIRNSGNVHSAPSGTIFIDGQGQKDLAVLAINPGSSMVLPETTREFEIPWDDGFPSRDEKGKLSWDTSKLNKIRFGKYTAHMIMVYDNGDRDVPIESFVSFWVIPWRIIAAFVALPVIPALLVFFIMKVIYRKRKEPVL